jgi:Response regulator containing CheY-like receiver, AAA-type ATPase, and DNA-binding domains
MKRILIIDDSRDLLEAMRMFLELKNYNVKTLTDCNDIIQIVKEYDPDLVIVDVFLSGEDGRDICKKLKEYDETKHVCIILLSGSPDILRNHKEFGADSFIEKPFDVNHLLEKIEGALDICDDQKFKI